MHYMLWKYVSKWRWEYENALYEYREMKIYISGDISNHFPHRYTGTSLHRFKSSKANATESML